MAPLVVFEPGPPARIVPSDPLGPWALPALERLLRAAEADHRPITLDLTQAPVSDPTSVAAVLWADDVSREHHIPFEVLVPDMVSAELLDFAGVDAPVYTPQDASAGERFVRRASAY